MGSMARDCLQAAKAKPPPAFPPANVLMSSPPRLFVRATFTPAVYRCTPGHPDPHTQASASPLPLPHPPSSTPRAVCTRLRAGLCPPTSHYPTCGVAPTHLAVPHMRVVHAVRGEDAAHGPLPLRRVDVGVAGERAGQVLHVPRYQTARSFVGIEFRTTLPPSPPNLCATALPRHPTHQLHLRGVSAQCRCFDKVAVVVWRVFTPELLRPRHLGPHPGPELRWHASTAQALLLYVKYR